MRRIFDAAREEVWWADKDGGVCCGRPLKLSGEADSAFSAERVQTFAWFEGKPLNYSLDNIPRTQTIEPVYVETSAFFIFSRELWCKQGRRIGDNPHIAVVDHIEGLDIDYPEDFQMAELILSIRS